MFNTWLFRSSCVHKLLKEIIKTNYKPNVKKVETKISNENFLTDSESLKIFYSRLVLEKNKKLWFIGTTLKNDSRLFQKFEDF